MDEDTELRVPCLAEKIMLGLREDGCEDPTEPCSRLVGLVDVDMDDVDGRPYSSVTAADAGESELAGTASVSGAGNEGVA